jgi:hypothetical protein
VPDSEHGLPLDLHIAEEGVLTQRSLLPVSKCRRSFCAGVPRVALTKYNVCYQISAFGRHPHTALELTSLSNVACTVSVLRRSRSLDNGSGTSLRWTGKPTTCGGPSVRLYKLMASDCVESKAAAKANVDKPFMINIKSGCRYPLGSRTVRTP